MRESILLAIADRYGLRKRSSGYAGPCPKCGGSRQSDKFVIKVDGGFKCYSCGWTGDAITWQREMEGRSCPEAHLELGLDCRKPDCPVHDTCRLGSGNGGGRQQRRRQSVRPPVVKNSLAVAQVEPATPRQLWLEWATALVAKAHQQLLGNSEQLAWLAARGIGIPAVRRFGLGWLEHDQRVDRASIGLPVDGDKDRLWVPGGLLINIVRRSEIHRLRVRRTPEAMARFLPERKYIWLQGSGNMPMAILPQSGEIRGAVIVEAELDAMACAAAHDQVLVVAVGSVSGGVDQELAAQLAAAPVILVALDAEFADDGSPGPGPQAVARWRSSYRQARYWPVPVGKDPGDYAIAGGDLRGWIEAGLVPALPSRQSHELPLSPVLSHQGDGGADKKSSEVDDFEAIAGLKWCRICWGDRFFAPESGGYFCVECQPHRGAGRLVRATVALGEYEVD